ncbi:alpha/beta-hydrolase [Rickenella mellea]|uniref:Alpha/beta-hydrolase n=1 Tax=Rickenella mellea TaxID=50990 RepID=A0A4Y7Q4F2_9AGAM|nr:alpha/beta-hydrolase [Rickenella mellea]
MSNHHPFTIAIPDSDIVVLKQKLALTRLPDEIEQSGWNYGVPLSDIRRLLARWEDGYDWRIYEAQINRLSQFTCDIYVDGFETLRVHYVHEQSKSQHAIPLLIVHGWPGHFLEAKKILPLLTATSPTYPSFHVVVLGLPNFGFSQGTTKKGFELVQYAEVAHKLMVSIGYNEYVTYGGDWGYHITRMMAHMYGLRHVKAWHTTMPIGEQPRFTSNPFLRVRYMLTPFSNQDLEGFSRSMWFRKRGRGYLAEQSTQPQTLGYLLADSPVGLLAWIYEKLVTWTDHYQWTDDEVLTWVSIYWFSCAGPAASTRIYFEVANGAGFRNIPQVTSIPMGVSYFPKELTVLPKLWTRTIGSVVFESEHKFGGHFAMYERPDELASDIRRMFGKGGPAYGVVRGNHGFDDALASSKL